jgi:hypothetical protein
MTTYRKPTLNETIEANKKAMRDQCLLFDKPIPKEFEAAPVVVKATRMKSDIPTEHEEQKMFVKWFRRQYPKVRIFAIPNSAIRSPELASYLRAEGLTSGVPDLYIPEWHTWVEMKRIKGSVISDEQKGWAEYLLGIGDKHIFGFGFEDARIKLHETMK